MQLQQWLMPVEEMEEVEDLPLHHQVHPITLEGIHPTTMVDHQMMSHQTMAMTMDQFVLSVIRLEDTPGTAPGILITDNLIPLMIHTETMDH
jgi:hypothetical protein